MYKYGIINKIPLYKNIWQMILNFLPESHWYKLKRQNTSFYQLIKDACIENDIKYLASTNLIESVIKMGANDWNRGLYGACEGGHKEMAVYMISKGANYWNQGLGGACKGGHKEMADYMISKGATKCDNYFCTDNHKKN